MWPKFLEWYFQGRYDLRDRPPVKLVTGTLDDGKPADVAVEVDEIGEPQLTLLTPPPKPTRPTVQKIQGPIVLTAAEAERSFRLWRKHLTKTRRRGSTDSRAVQAAGQVFRSMRRFNLLRRRPAAGPVKGGTSALIRDCCSP
jgi:hypothetical protein